jgi:hypothetical protein
MVDSKARILLCKTNVGIIIVASERPSLETILKCAQVTSGSYAAGFVERVYQFLVGRASDVRKEYNDYYAAEYDDLREFLHRKHCVSLGWLRKMDQAIEGDTFLGFVGSGWGRDWLIDSLIEYDDKYNAVARALNAEWVDVKDETQI